MRLILMCGPSGSGKSAYIKTHFPEAVICSADYAMLENGEYKFDVSKLSAAHRSCQYQVYTSMKEYEPEIVVDNTNLKKRERLCYLEMAEQFGYTVEVYALPFTEKIINRNIHGVSIEKVTEQTNKCDIPLGAVYIETTSSITKVKDILPSETGAD